MNLAPAAPHRTRFAQIAVRARHIVDSNLVPSTAAVPDWPARLVELEQLWSTPPPLRRKRLAEMDDDALCDVLVLAYLRAGTPYALWADTPSGFAEDILGTPSWSRKRAILDATVQSPQVAAPVCFGAAKTEIAATLAVWHIAVHRPGDAFAGVACPDPRAASEIVVHLAQLAGRAELPGSASASYRGWSDVVGGQPMLLAAAMCAYPEEGGQYAFADVRSPHLLVVAADAGHHQPLQGAAVDYIVPGSGRLVAVGTPAQLPGSWFEDLAGRPGTHTVRMTVADLPPATKEFAGECTDCPPSAGRHSWGAHVPDPGWAERVIARYGAAHPYVTSHVHAQFPAMQQTT
ncbi:hypothetical protein ACGFYQ_33905 [Streptomyces sp. NPDC048258]|uniref:hypothetical protein n=1 Tax=Streptomyces sp. NPDC048258 TaxID=3365527 RepID=UPI0037201E0F